MIDQAFADQQTAAYNATLHLHGNVFGIRFFGYGTCVIYKLSNPEKSAFLQGEEAYELWEQADNAPNSIARDNLLDQYINY